MWKSFHNWKVTPRAREGIADRKDCRQEYRPVMAQDGAISEELNPRQQKFVVAIVEGKSAIGAAEIAGVSRRTATRYMADHAVQQEVRRLVEARRAAALAGVSALADDAIKALKEVLVRADTDSAKVRAATVVLRALLGNPSKGGATAAVQVNVDASGSVPAYEHNIIVGELQRAREEIARLQAELAGD